jgi:methylenetetrahydrofolate reductase (NADPH)
MIEFCKTKVPMEITESMEPIKSDDELIRKFGIDFGVKMCNELRANGIKFLHFYTMNLERSVIDIIKDLGIIDT